MAVLVVNLPCISYSIGRAIQRASYCCRRSDTSIAHYVIIGS